MPPSTESHESANHSAIFGLATIAGHANTRRDLRLKAIRALARIPDQNAIRVLGEMALWEEDEELRSEAYRSLEATFGDDLPEVLESIRQELTGIRVESSTDDDDAVGEMEMEADAGVEVRLQPEYPPQSQIVPVEGTPLWLLWVLIGLVIFGVLAYIFLVR